MMQSFTYRKVCPVVTMLGHLIFLYLFARNNGRWHGLAERFGKAIPERGGDRTD